jgi:molecular chaperone HtpG
VPRGTEVTLHLKQDSKKYLETYVIERIVKTYSDHVLFPILLEFKEGEPRQLNAASAIWQRPKSELKPEDYKQAYQSFGGVFDEPAMTVHYKAEGRQSYAVLLFAPSTKPFDLNDSDRKGHVKLYVRRVYITDGAELLPAYLRFIRGVVDSEDMPLNISREMLQNNPLVAQIRKALTTRVVSELESLAEKDAEAFGKVWGSFGHIIKEGVYDDHERRAALLALSRFETTNGTGRTLKQYVTDLRPNQTEIYYLVGDSIDRLKSNPNLEAARARGIEVLLLTEAVDALWTSHTLDFEGKPLKSLSQGQVDFSLVPHKDEAAKPKDEAKAEAADEATVIAAVKEAIGDRVSDVRASQRLVDSPACLVAAGGFDRHLSRLLARQKSDMIGKPVLELNMAHAMVRALSRAKTDARTDDVSDLAALLYEQAKILDGEVPDDPAAFASRLNRLVVRGLPV